MTSNELHKQELNTWKHYSRSHERRSANLVRSARSAIALIRVGNSAAAIGALTAAIEKASNSPIVEPGDSRERSGYE